MPTPPPTSTPPTSSPPTGAPGRRVTRFDLDAAALAAQLDDLPAYRTRQVWDGLYRRAVEPADMTDLPRAVRARVAEALPAALAPVAESVSDGGDTVKFLWALDGGARIETVLMRYHDRATVCVSTQAGCAMGCGFCATGQGGFDRHLSVGEIVEQVVRAVRHSRAGTPSRRVSNVVFMGMGEPLANYDATWAAVERIHADLGISARHITVSTVGIIPGIRRLTAERLPVNLAVSLHAANDELRDELVPINRRYPLAALTEACRQYVDITRRRLSLEWALIDGVNDRRSDARELADLARSLRAHVNLIPLNPTPGYPARGTPPVGVRGFRDLLVAFGANATVRRNRGTDIAAACGQLVAAHGSGEASVPVRIPATAPRSTAPPSTAPRSTATRPARP